MTSHRAVVIDALRHRAVIVYSTYAGWFYVGRLVILDATSPLILAPAAIEGVIVNPVWYAWLGTTFWRRTSPKPTAARSEDRER